MESKVCDTCGITIDYGYGHQCYSDIYVKLFEGLSSTKSFDLEKTLEKLKDLYK